MPELRAHGTTLHYESAGSGPALLLTHGFGDSGLLWLAQVEALAPRFQVITHDLRGHARSGSPLELGTYTQDQVVEDVRAILDHLGVQRAVLGGHSLGGYTSLRFYQRYPERVRALILSGTGPGFRKLAGARGWTETNETEAAQFEAQGLETVLDARRARIGRHGGAAPIHHVVRGLAFVRRGVMRMPPLVEPGEIACPALVLVGEQDAPFRNAAEYMVAKLPNASGPVVLDGATHWANFDRPTEWNAAVVAFLDALPPEGAA